MQCPICKNEVGAQNAFCNQCGAPLGSSMAGAVPAGAGAGAPPPPMYGLQPVASGSGLSENAAAAIAYITIIPAIIFLVLEPYNRMPLVRFHAWQSIALGVAAFVLQIAVTIAQIMLHFIPLSFVLFWMVHLAIAVGLFLFWMIAILKASKGEFYKIPVLGEFAEKQARG